MKTLVTGATGFIGSHVVRKLIGAGHRVRILSRPSSPTQLIEGLPVETVIGDITDSQSVDEAVRGCEAVFHVAGLVSFWRGSEKLLYDVNVIGTRNVVSAALKHRVRRLVHTSSISAIGFASNGRLGDEEIPYNWGKYRIPYCDSKNLGEREVLEGVKKGLDAVIVNPAVVFGPGDIHNHGSAIVLYLARRKIPFYFNGGCCTSDVLDVAEGHLKALEKGKIGERYILGGENFDWKRLFETIAETLGVEPPRRKIPTPVLFSMAWIADFAGRLRHRRPRFTPESIRISRIPVYFSSEKAIRELGYRVTPIRETIQRTNEWYLKNVLSYGGN